ncbi:hypothetical protein HQ576_00025, partial [bacterium]|nr:hypothetical protein [bacterium]
RHTTGEKDSGFDVWPLVGHHKEGEATRSYALWPLVHSQREKDESSQMAFPFYFLNGSKDKDGEESGNLLVLPAVYRQWDKDGKLTVTPLWAAAQRKGARWSLLLPLYYRQSNDEKQASQLITPLWSTGSKGDSRWSALFPLYYHWADDKKQASQLITPLAMRQQSAKGSSWTFFPLLSNASWHEGEKDLWFLWPLVHAMWGGKRTSHHVAPLYYYEREGERSSFVTALYARDKWPDRKATCIPLLLSNFEANDKTKRKDLTVLASIGQASWGPDKLRHSVFPLYGYNREKQAFVTPLVSWKTTPGDRFVNLLGPVAHTWTNGKGRRTFHFAWPFTKWTVEKGKGLTYSRISPLFSREARAKGCDFWLFPWMSIKTREDWSRGSFFPLWSYGRKVQSKEGLTDTDFSLLGWLYDYQFRGGRHPKDKPEEKEDYTRARVLWRLYHHERVNDDQSLDVFPFITWDKKADGRGQFSFFWRLFRTARTANGGRKLDVLFIPLIRKAGTKPAA